MSLVMLGQSTLFRQAVHEAERFARSSIPVLLVGETGTGKELFAQYIHQQSERPGPFVDVDCGAVPHEMIESLLFGHRRGAFTSAVDDTDGLFFQAHEGTIFLDELSSLPLGGQAKLLRVLETKQVRRLGETNKHAVDFRVIAAVQDDCLDRVERGSFRRDLYHRIAGARLLLPPLRARPDDIALLARHFAAQHERHVSLDAIQALRVHAWPGNIRELRAAIDRAAMLCEDRYLTSTIVGRVLDRADAPTADAVMRQQLVDLCAAHDWDPVRTAQAMMISRATLYRRLRAHGIRLHQISKSHAISSRLETK